MQHRACFLYPGCGSYLRHHSGCEATLGVRESSWGNGWVGEGFRCARRGRRYLGAWQEKGGARWLTDALNLDDDRLVWRTERPPSAWDDVRWGWRLWNRGWFDQYNQWVGPRLPRSGTGWGSGWSHETEPSTEAGEPSPSPAGGWRTGPKAWQGTMQQLRDYPDGYRQLRGGVYSPITRLAEELVTDPEWLDQVGLPDADSRVGRHRRASISAYVRRYFVDDGEAFFFLLVAEPLASLTPPPVIFPVAEPLASQNPRASQNSHILGGRGLLPAAGADSAGVAGEHPRPVLPAALPSGVVEPHPRWWLVLRVLSGCVKGEPEAFVGDPDRGRERAAALLPSPSPAHTVHALGHPA